MSEPTKEKQVLQLPTFNESLVTAEGGVVAFEVIIVGGVVFTLSGSVLLFTLGGMVYAFGGVVFTISGSVLLFTLGGMVYAFGGVIFAVGGVVYAFGGVVFAVGGVVFACKKMSSIIKDASADNTDLSFATESTSESGKDERRM